MASEKDIELLKRENNLLQDEIRRLDGAEKEHLREQLERMKGTLEDKRFDQADEVKRQISELQNRFLEEIRSMTEQTFKLKEDHELKVNDMKKH
jgi:hypothetical protein